jgi:hypothetical protein
VVGDHGYKQTRRGRRRPQKGAEQQRNKTTIFFWVTTDDISKNIPSTKKKTNIENLNDGVGYRNIARKPACSRLIKRCMSVWIRSTRIRTW